MRLVAGVSVQEVRHASFAQVYACASPSEGEDAPEVFAQLADVLAEGGVEPIRETIYGSSAARESILASRASAFRARGLDASRALTFVDGAPARGGGFAGVQLWGIVPGAPGAATVETVDGGRLWTGRGFRMLHLAGVRGAAGEPATRQAERMFENAGAAAEAHGFRYAQAVRTWIYLARLLDWYGEFNRVRTAYYAKQFRGSRGFPASTGIQGRDNSDAECYMDALFLDAREGSARARPVAATSRQNPAFAYGSAFSRGTVVEIEGRRTVHISGTASIDREGRSVHAGDAEAQCTETMRNIAALLEDQGGALTDVGWATVFCKSADVYAAYLRVIRSLRMSTFPGVCVLGDICRPELLIEIEAVANI